jgi:preprotein translocase subunit SecY
MRNANCEIQTFLSMGFIHVESLEGIMRLSVSKDMLFYIAITLPLMIATILGWWLWEYMSKRKKRAGMEEDDEEKVKDM